MDFLKMVGAVVVGNIVLGLVTVGATKLTVAIQSKSKQA